jgi:hypothetical protein
LTVSCSLTCSYILLCIPPIERIVFKEYDELQF